MYKKEVFQPCVKKAYEFLDITQVKENVPNYDKVFRMPSKGAFPFSTRDCGWIVSDCTAEALKSIIYLHHTEFVALSKTHIHIHTHTKKKKKKKNKPLFVLTNILKQ